LPAKPVRAERTAEAARVARARALRLGTRRGRDQLKSEKSAGDTSNREGFGPRAGGLWRGSLRQAAARGEAFDGRQD